MAFPVNPKLDVDVTRVDATPVHKLGEEHQNENGTVFQYCRIPYTSITPAALYQIDPNQMVVSCTAAGDSTRYVLPTRFGVFQGASPGTLTSASGGWFAVRGPMSVLAQSALTANAKVYTGTTAGQISTTSTSANLIHGLSANGAYSGSGTLASCYAIMNLSAAVVS